MEPSPTNTSATDRRKRRWSLATLSLGTLMTALDGSIVNVALPSIKLSLHLSDLSLVWVVNSYLLTLGGFLLLGGRLGDIYGGRRIFLVGIALFTGASFGCGIATSQALLIGARAVQGIGGAIVSAVSRGLALNLFVTPRDRARAMSVFAFVQVGGGTLGLMLGGYLTGALGWHSIFLVNCPIGAAVFCSGLFLPVKSHHSQLAQLDIAGAVTITASLLITLYLIGNYSQTYSTSALSYCLLAVAVLFLVTFFWIEARVAEPLVPLRLLRLRNFVIANVIYVLLSASAATWGFICTIYLQLVLHFSPMQVGLSFLPVATISGGYALVLSAPLVIRFGIKPSLSWGLLIAATGFTLFSLMSSSGSLEVVITSTILIGLGGTIAATPLVLAGTQDIPRSFTGLASGVLSTTCTIGAALGLAALAGTASARTNSLLLSGRTELDALGGGYRLVSLVCAAILIAALAGAALLRLSRSRTEDPFVTLEPSAPKSRG